MNLIIADISYKEINMNGLGFDPVYQDSFIISWLYSYTFDGDPMGYPTIFNFSNLVLI